MQTKVREYIDKLNLYRKLYYNDNISAVSDTEYDKLFDELQQLEQQTGLIYADSPTQSVGWQVLSSLNKVEHNHLMLSLPKTKKIDEVETFLKAQSNLYLAMCKMDGLTCSLRYINGKLISAETRGDGVVGEDILHNALTLKSIPYQIPYKEELILDGEIICTYDNFEKFSSEYKNPRNFASGSIRLLDANECQTRNLTFVVWDVIKGLEECLYLTDCFYPLSTFGFTTVPWEIEGSVENQISTLQEEAKKLNYPIDGIVFKFDERKIAQELGHTSHHFNNAIAWKPFDETYDTRLKSIDWTMGRTGVLTPVAVFEPIEIEGTLVERASLHNVSIMEELLGVPYYHQKIKIYKANMIIPQIYSAEKISYDEVVLNGGALLPTLEKCPCCGSLEVNIELSNETKVMKCNNPACEGKLLNRLDHFCGKKGLDIKGLSKATLNKLIDWNWVSNFQDIANLSVYEKEWQLKAGFGVKSVQNILNAINQSFTEAELWKVISSAGIPLVGRNTAQILEKEFKTWKAFREAVDNNFDFTTLKDFGEALNDSILNYNYTDIDNVVKMITFKKPEQVERQEKSLNDIIIVITGKLNKFKNRDALKIEIEKRGGKVVGSISGKTNYLINNDTESTSAKNKTAKEKGIPIISEEDFIKKFLN